MMVPFILLSQVFPRLHEVPTQQPHSLKKSYRLCVLLQNGAVFPVDVKQHAASIFPL